MSREDEKRLKDEADRAARLLEEERMWEAEQRARAEERAWREGQQERGEDEMGGTRRRRRSSPRSPTRTWERQEAWNDGRDREWGGGTGRECGRDTERRKRGTRRWEEEDETVARRYY